MSATQFLHGIAIKEINNGTRPIQGLSSSIIGIVGTAPDADPEAFPLDTPVLVTGSRTEAAALDTTGDNAGTLPQALTDIFDQTGATVVVIRVDAATDATAQTAAIIGAVTPDGKSTGIQALLEAEHETGFKPRILIAPGFTNDQGVAKALQTIADKLRGIIVKDGPNTTDADAIKDIANFGSDRVYIVDPALRKTVNGEDTIVPASASIAGLIAAVDYTEGVQCSPSNHEIQNVIGTARPVSFINGDPTSRANLLNEKNIATIIRQNGFRLWGNRTPSADPKYAFLCVRRVSDLIADAIQRSMLWATDKPVNKSLFDAVADSVNAYLRSLKSENVILGGECWYDREQNANTDLASGKVRFRYKFTAPAPAEDISFDAELVEDYYDAIFTK